MFPAPRPEHKPIIAVALDFDIPMPTLRKITVPLNAGLDKFEPIELKPNEHVVHVEREPLVWHIFVESR